MARDTERQGPIVTSTDDLARPWSRIDWARAPAPPRARPADDVAIGR